MIEVSDFAHFSSQKAAHGTAVTIGNFDGCHLGHQGLIAETLQQAEALQALPVAVTFDPRPEAYFRGHQEILLFTPEQKTRALGELGVTHQIVQAFDESFSRVTHDQFYEDFLRQRLGARSLVIGDNFRFGHNRLGDATYLAVRARVDAVNVTIGEATNFAGERISSTRIRTTLHQEGDVLALASMLGRPYMIEGIIQQGDQLGRMLGTPTANLEQTHQLLPRFGIYAGYVWMATAAKARPPVTFRPADAVPAVFSIGIRPTLAQAEPPVRIEAHLLQGHYGANELYGRRAGYYLSHRVRDEAQFTDLAELKAWIAKDIATARCLLGLSE